MAADAAARVEEPALYEAIVRVAVAPMHAEPHIASQMISQQLAGHGVDVVEEHAEWTRARGPDGYDGWMHQGFLARPAEDEGSRDRAPGRVSLGCVTRNGFAGERALPLRARLAPEEVVESGDVLESGERRRRFPPDGVAITESARHFFHGTSYLWGGVTPWGADCSGLVQSVFALHGVQLPRDAWQQSRTGGDIGRDIGELVAADLVFFSDRDDGFVTHVAIALGDRRIVHLALGRGGYAIERMDAERDPYVRKLRDRFLFARRVL